MSKLSEGLSILQKEGLSEFFVRSIFFILNRIAPSRIVNIANVFYISKRLSMSYGFFEHQIYSEETKLGHISDQYGTDKGGKYSPVPWSLHHYTPIYNLIFGNLNPKRVLECGIGDFYDDKNLDTTNRAPGASLRMWRDYFENAEIYGIDIDSAKLIHSDKIQSYQVDQTSSESIELFLQRLNDDLMFDIIIDDGLHTGNAAISLFKHTYNRLNQGGFYIVEDLGLTHAEQFFDFINKSEFEYDLYFLNSMNDSLIIIRKLK